jgi:hypothetical protein
MKYIRSWEWPSKYYQTTTIISKLLQSTINYQLPTAYYLIYIFKMRFTQSSVIALFGFLAAAVAYYNPERRSDEHILQARSAFLDARDEYLSARDYCEYLADIFLFVFFLN